MNVIERIKFYMIFIFVLSPIQFIGTVVNDLFVTKIGTEISSIVFIAGLIILSHFGYEDFNNSGNKSYLASVVAAFVRLWVEIKIIISQFKLKK